MKKNHLYFASLADTFFFSTLFYILMFYLFSSKQSRAMALALSVLTTALFLFVLYEVSVRLRQRAWRRAERSRFDERVLASLVLAGTREQRRVFSGLFPEKTVVFIPSHPSDPVDRTKVLLALNGRLGQPLHVVTTGVFSQNAVSFLSSFPEILSVYDGQKLIAAMRKRQIFPPVRDVAPEIVRRRSARAVIKTVLSKENTVRYLRYAAVMSVGALFTRFNLYFSVTAAVFLTLCLASFIYKKASIRRLS